MQHYIIDDLGTKVVINPGLIVTSTTTNKTISGTVYTVITLQILKESIELCYKGADGISSRYKSTALLLGI